MKVLRNFAVVIGEYGIDRYAEREFICTVLPGIQSNTERCQDLFFLICWPFVLNTLLIRCDMSGYIKNRVKWIDL